MADRILKAVARTEAVAEQVALSDSIHDLIVRFAKASIYQDPTKIDELASRLVLKAQTQFIPLANAAGVLNADDLLVGIEKRVVEGRERDLTARAVASLRRDTNKNILNLTDGLKSAKLKFRAETVAELRRARFGVENRRQVMNRLTKADKDDLASWTKFQTEHRAAQRDETAALKRLAKRPSKDDFEELKTAQEEQRKAANRMRRRTSFLARFENATAREMIDTFRVQSRLAQDARFRQLGFTGDASMTWITVNGADTCPDCTEMHGVTKKNSEWDGQRPGSGFTASATRA
jgi:hypothetical protein